MLINRHRITTLRLANWAHLGTRNDLQIGDNYRIKQNKQYLEMESLMVRALCYVFKDSNVVKFQDITFHRIGPMWGKLGYSCNGGVVLPIEDLDVTRLDLLGTWVLVSYLRAHGDTDIKVQPVTDGRLDGVEYQGIGELTWKSKFVAWDPLEEARRRIKLWRPGQILCLVSLGLTDGHMSSLNIPEAVTDLDLTGNGVTDLSSVKFPSGMTRLSVRKNKLQYIDGTTLPNLYLLDVSSNPLRSFVAIRNLKNVHSFLARWCGLTSLVGVPSGVVHLDVSRNQITSMDVGTADVSALDVIDASWNYIHTLGDLRMFSSLRCLYLCGNVELTYCKHLSVPSTLKHLSLRECSLVSRDLVRVPKHLQDIYPPFDIITLTRISRQLGPDGETVEHG